MYRRILNKIKRVIRIRPKGGFVLNKDPESFFIKDTEAEIINSNITLVGKSRLIVHKHAKIDGYNIYLQNGCFELGEYSQLLKGYQVLNPSINIDAGNLLIGDHNIIKASFSIRFGGTCTIGIYNGINEETEIRCDDAISIGDYNLISYECMIYDTNTHCIYPPVIRRERSKADFPYMAMELEKPTTKKVVIGSDNWFGKRSVVLKGCVIGNQVIIGAMAVVSNLNVDNKTVVGNPAYVIDKRS